MHALSQEDVHIWHWPTDSRISTEETALSSDEVERADRYVRPEDRRRFVQARHGLRAILSIYLGVDPRSLTFVVGTHGKPSLPCCPAIAFNHSHSSKLAVVALTNGRVVGVDVEKITPFHVDMADALSPLESRMIADASSEERGTLFARMWTAKEALVKASGAGFQVPPRFVEPGGSWRTVTFEPEQGFVGCVAVEGATPILSIGRFEPSSTSLPETISTESRIVRRRVFHGP